jgi:hypothetical protein
MRCSTDPRSSGLGRHPGSGRRILGYGTEITRLVIDYALGTVGLHRISLDIYDVNPRAQRVPKGSPKGLREVRLQP